MANKIGFDSRRLVGASQSTSGKDLNETYLERLVKLIPLEVVTLYVTLTGILKSSPGHSDAIDWIVVGVCFIGSWFYLLILVEAKKKQIWLSSAGFLVWVFALGGPFESLSWYKPLYAALVLPIFTFFVPIIQSTKKKKD